MALKASEISQLIKERIENFEAKAEARDVGTVVSVTDGIVRIHGLADARYGEMLEFPGNSFGMALNLEQDSVGSVVLGDYKHISEGDTVKTTGRILEVPIGDALLGRVVDSLGNPIDGKGPIEAEGTAPIEKVAPGVIERQSVSQPVQTGLKSIDSMVPIGRGQRELIIGDRQTGKTAVAVDTIINQRGTGIKCIYVAIGQKASSIAGVKLGPEVCHSTLGRHLARAVRATVMSEIALEAGRPFEIVDTVIAVNDRIKRRAIERVREAIGEDLGDKPLRTLGMAVEQSEKTGKMALTIMPPTMTVARPR